MTGYSSGSTLLVNDPGFSKSSYPIGEVVGIRVYGAKKQTMIEEMFSRKNF
jgi:hypothetical protein